MTLALTDDERALLRAVHRHLAWAVADPDHGIPHMRRGTRSSYGHGFTHHETRDGIEGTWNEWGPDPDQPGRYLMGAVLREVSISYTRLRAWIVSLPDDVRAQALTWWRTYPVDTRDIPRLQQLILDQLTDPEPDDEPTDLLGLLDHLDKETA